METIRGEEQAGERLKRTALRDFKPLPDDYERVGTSYKLSVDRHDAPVPVLMRYALTLIGLRAQGPSEKVAWSVAFAYRGQYCSLFHQKFGLRLYMRTEAGEEEAHRSMGQIMKQLRASMRTVERLILDAAPDLLGKGDATVVNQHWSLRRAYEYFRERAIDPVLIEDVRTQHSPTSWSFTNGKAQMDLNAFHDMVAAISAYLSLLEHNLVLALAFSGFDPSSEDLTAAIGSRWGEKFDRVLGKEREAVTYRQRITDVVERWRNPYSHGGFEKGHGATLYLHAPGIGALPVGLTRVRSSPLFSFLPASETDITQVFALFDEVDAWLSASLPEAMEWIDSGLDVRFDKAFRAQQAEARRRGAFAPFLRRHELRQEMVDNMDY